VVTVLPATCAQAGINGNIGCQVVNGGLDLGSPIGAYGQYTSDFVPTTGSGFDGIPDVQFAQLQNLTRFNGNQYNTRIDYVMSKKNTFAVSTYFVPAKAFTSDVNAQSRPQADVNSNRLNYDVGVVWNRIISAMTLNEARFNITRWGYDETKSNPTANFALPRVEIEGFFNGRLRFGFPQAPNTPGVISEKQLDFRDILTRTIGNQVFKFGGEYRRDLNSNGEVGGARPDFSMSGLWNFSNGAPIFEGIVADSTGKPSANNTKFHTSELAFFVQDDWKYRPNLTLNLGLRWDYFSPITADNGVLGNLILDANGGLAGAHISTAKQFYHKDLNNFGPQVGFAWSPERFHARAVVRGGFGMGYDRLPNALLANARRNPPNGHNFGICCGTTGSPFVGGQILFAGSTDGTIFGYPRNPVLGVGTGTNGLPLNGAIEIYGAPQKLPTPYVYRWSLEGQYQLPRNLVATLGYQGSAGHHFVRINPLQITAPTVNPNISAAFFASPDVNSNYNAMLARLQGRFMKQLSFDMNYRFSKSIDTDSYEAPTALTNQSFPVDQHQERGPSDFDVKHYFTASALWDIPFFNHEPNTWKGRLLGGWHIDSVLTMHSGFPWTPRLFGCLQGSTSNNAAFCDPRPTMYNGKQPLANTNANFLSPGGIFPGGGAAYFNTSVPFGPPFAALPAIGRNRFRGPRYHDVDMSFAKRFGLPSFGVLGESAALDVKFNFFNIFNTLNLTPFNALSDPTRVSLQAFGTATSALAGRTGEFQIRFSF
jgi:outer membrane receptor protein involved in Fe transport